VAPAGARNPRALARSLIRLPAANYKEPTTWIAANKGAVPAITDLIGGQFDLLCDQTTNTTPQIQAGKVRAFAVTTPKRLAMPLLKKLNDALKVALKDPDFIRREELLGAVVATDGRIEHAGHRKVVIDEIAKWTPVIKAAGVYTD